MKYRQPIVVLSLLLFLVAVALTGFLLYQRNQGGLPMISQGGGGSLITVNPLPTNPNDNDNDNDNSSNEKDDESELEVELPIEQGPSEELDPPVPAAPQEPKRDFTQGKEYKVVRGDSVSTITVREWGNLTLWPDLYVNNQWIYQDPDLILPGEMVMIFDKLGQGRSQLNESEVQELLEAYVQVYKLYAKLGEKRNASKWYTLGLALRVEPRFFEIYGDQIDSRDIEMVKSLNRQSSALR